MNPQNGWRDDCVHDHSAPRGALNLPVDDGPLDLAPIHDLLAARANAISPDGQHPWLNKRLAEQVPALVAELEATRTRLEAVAEAVSA